MYSYFYRVENTLGEGPYQATNSGGSKRWRTQLHSHLNGRPTLYDETGRMPTIRDGQIFGFKTLHQLQRWFRPEELRRLEKLGYRVCRVRGRAVLSTKTQVLFERI
jgi:hypothetical protein